MNKKYKCVMCGSVSKDTLGTCYGAERKEVVSNVCVASQRGNGEHTNGDGHKDGDGHDHDKKDTSGICLACQGRNGVYTCSA
ncbi:hypothetical protein COW99_06280 [Candidatus Roizmanbacteria bacterium CG22_combo_CG10-13_8_21_14_all_38_20]|uniref:Uncharacterized protein n=1 Tax=Candidatus Roizmanbacteria bacterium CG22_combo_CG10-13_8_21_14_all_38_20 TaxID=1974862 RepID=A0A2H0BTU9_9BACT|nr:MAG: hypothetical protein COW99_06280 [Candidatus Roizmanbacteria bacterium CG22_combo_CG10-13_8_21_14_all_38_20]